MEIVLKCSSAGCVDAARSAIEGIRVPDVDIAIIQSGVGAIRKSDIVMAATGSGLIAGFEVEVLSGLEKELLLNNVEVRLYDVIYAMTGDIQNIAERLRPKTVPDKVLGTAKVIALFPSTRKGIIIGCEVMKGHLAVGERFRIISAMGLCYTGVIESIHIGKDAVQKATPGHQCGIKIRNFNKVHIGDKVESYQPISAARETTWKPRGEIIRIT